MNDPRKSRYGKTPGDGEPPTWAVATVVASIALVVLIASLPASVQRALPFGDSDYFYIFLIFLPMIMMAAAMVIFKVGEAEQAAGWSQASARIISSGIEVRHHQFEGSTSTVKNVPVVQYEFTAKGRKWHGNRISIGEDYGGANTEATLAKYKPGVTVTVYYDPKDPQQAVLERDMPQGFGKGCAAIVAFVAGGVVAIYYLTTNASYMLEKTLPDANAPLTVFATSSGLMVLLLFFGMRRAMKRAMSWPFVTGKVEVSTTESYSDTLDRKTRRMYAPVVEYSYTVNAVTYRSKQINLGVVASGSQVYAEKVAARYPEGSDVEVHYDPANPANAALENPTGVSWLILAVAAACFGIAIYTSGVFK